MKPLTIAELKVGEWVWIIKGENSFYAHILSVDSSGLLFDKTPHSVWLNYGDYGTKWLAYKNKEQAESKGEWVDFHCKVGDTVYYPWLWENEDGVASAEVEHIATRPDGKFILYLNLDSDVVEYVMEYREHLISDFGKTWFTDKPEAEARLKDLRGEK